MKDLSEKVSYLQGLCEGLNVNDSSPNGKIISGVLQVLEEMADIMESMQMEFDNLREYVEDMDDEMIELEEKLWGGDSDDAGIVELTCSKCGEDLYIESDVLDEDVLEIICPNCNNTVYVNDGSFDYFPEQVDEEINSKDDTVNPSPS